MRHSSKLANTVFFAGLHVYVVPHVFGVEKMAQASFTGQVRRFDDDMNFLRLRHVFMLCWIVVRSRRLRVGRRLGSTSTGPDAAVPVQALYTPRLIQALGTLEGELGQ